MQVAREIYINTADSGGRDLDRQSGVVDRIRMLLREDKQIDGIGSIHLRNLLEHVTIAFAVVQFSTKPLPRHRVTGDHTLSCSIPNRSNGLIRRVTSGAGTTAIRRARIRRALIDRRILDIRGKKREVTGRVGECTATLGYEQLPVGRGPWKPAIVPFHVSINPGIL